MLSPLKGSADINSVLGRCFVLSWVMLVPEAYPSASRQPTPASIRRNSFVKKNLPLSSTRTGICAQIPRNSMKTRNGRGGVGMTCMTYNTWRSHFGNSRGQRDADLPGKWTLIAPPASSLDLRMTTNVE